MNEVPTPPMPEKSDRAIAITAIIATTIVLLACIAGCSAPLIIAAMNM
jgi:hypothetical protein